MRLLFVGDIVGEPGRKAVKRLIPSLRRRHDLDVVIANGENAAGGSGITRNTAQEIFSVGVRAITLGDHVWKQKDVYSLFKEDARVIRPLNYPPGTPGRGWTLVELDGLPPLAIMNAQGRTFMANLENPFLAVEKALSEIESRAQAIVLDFHAEATSEKIAMGRLCDGRVSAVLGTHTHVQTADEQIFPGGTAFLCDTGFTGPQESVLGRRMEPVIKHFKTLQPQKFEVASGDVRLNGAIVDIDDLTGKATRIDRVSEPLPEN